MKEGRKEWLPSFLYICLQQKLQEYVYFLCLQWFFRVNGGDDAAHPYFKVSQVSENKKFKFIANYPEVYTFETILESKNGKYNKLHYSVEVEPYSEYLMITLV